MKPLSDWGERDGFTLVELLIVIALVGLILSLSTSLNWTVQRLDARTREETAARENLVSAARMFRALIAGAVPDLRTPVDGASTGGTDAGMTLMSLGPPILAFDRPEPVTLTWRPGQPEGEGVLLLRWNDPHSKVLREETILQGARALSFSYFVEDRDRTNAAWRSEWTDRESLPLAVLLRIEIPALGPALEIVERSTGRMPSACAGLPHEAACRTDRGRHDHGR